jgi:hypothetical protein
MNDLIFRLIKNPVVKQNLATGFFLWENEGILFEYKKRTQAKLEFL